MMVRAAETLAEARRIHQLAGSAQVHPDYSPVARRIRAEATDNWDNSVAVQRFEKCGGRFVRGQATLVGPRRVRVGETVFTASLGVVLATGSAPVRPLILALTGFVVSFAIAVGVALLLAAGGFASAPLLVAIILCATSLGLVVPVLKDSGQIASPTGQLQAST